MTKHSTLTNPNDLHFAKVRSFNGDPANVTPEFPDQLLIATDTNKSYRATDAAQGALVELVASNNNGGNNASIDQVYPSDRPTEAGKFFYDTWHNQLYISIANFFGFLWWKTLERLTNIFNCSITIDTVDTAINSSAEFSLMYSELPPSEIESGSFTFSRVLGNISLGANDLSYYLNAYGKGCYTIGYTVNSTEPTFTRWDYTGSIPDGFEIRSTPYSLNALGKSISSSYLYFHGNKPDNLIQIAVSLFVVEIGG